MSAAYGNAGGAVAHHIETEALTKFYGRQRGVENLTLAVGPGEVFGFLGPNGAGKTTTIRLLMDLIGPTSGTVRVLGYDLRQNPVPARRRIGYLPGDLELYRDMSGRELHESQRRHAQAPPEGGPAVVSQCLTDEATQHERCLPRCRRGRSAPGRAHG